MNLLSIVGARPQFIKLAPLSAALRQHHSEKILHTGQHFDPDMSDVFFKQMGIPEPDFNLCISGGSHGTQTGQMLMGIEAILLSERPDMVIVFGDTNSTLAGALAASKLSIPVLHVEAGLRSYDRHMPEEINRIVTDTLSQILSCPCENAVQNLEKEGLTEGVFFTGDLMYDAALQFQDLAVKQEIFKLLQRKIRGFSVTEKAYYVLTMHRASNTEDVTVLRDLFEVLSSSPYPTIFPIHPRTAQLISKEGLTVPNTIHTVAPFGYLEMIALVGNAAGVITDSGGLQKEAFFLNTPCFTVRDTTEWIETLVGGRNHLVMSSRTQLNTALLDRLLTESIPLSSIFSFPYGNGQAAHAITHLLGSQ